MNKKTLSRILRDKHEKRSGKLNSNFINDPKRQRKIEKKLKQNSVMYRRTQQNRHREKKHRLNENLIG